MNVISLFDGISCARVALDKLGIAVYDYLASEVDENAIKISKKNYPDIIQIGDVRKVGKYMEFGGLNQTICEGIDLLIGGSPCQDLSIAKNNRKGLDGDRSGLFREYVRILRELKPRRFVLENVASMPKEAKDIITKELGVEPIMINASLVSAQNRKRLFWTNIPGVTQPKDKGIFLKDILDTDGCESYIVQRARGFNKGGEHYHKSPTLSSNARQENNKLTIRLGHIGKGAQAERIYSPEGKSVALSANGGGGGAKTGLYDINETVRKLTPVECERLQGLPDNYTEGVSNTQRYRCLGNAFNVDVVAHILSFIPK